jgi:hypothetical protein
MIPRKRRAKIAPALALGVAFLLGISLVVHCRHETGRSVRLPDGSTITLKSVTFGTNHCAPPHVLNRLLDQLPAPWLSRLHLVPPLRFDCAEPRICFWFATQSPPGAPTASRFHAAGRLRLVDDSGVEQREAGWLGWRGIAADTPTLHLEALSPAVFPRRQRFLRLRLDGGGLMTGAEATPNSRTEVELAIPNPRHADWPEWKPASLPASATCGDLEFTLTSLVIDLLPTPTTPASRTARSPGTTARFSIIDGDKPSRDWQVDRIHVEDATGNTATLMTTANWRPIRCDTDGPTEVVTFPWPLWLDEPAHRMRVEFVRKPDATFPPSELLEVTAVPVPPSDGISMINARTNLLGYELGLLAWVGEHATLPGREHDVFGQTTLEVEVPPLPDDLRFDVVRVLDDSGHPVASVPGAGGRSYGFQIPATARMLDIRVALTKRRVAEYFVKPAVRGAR